MRKVAEIGSPEEPAGLAFYRWLEEEVLTEENSDAVIDIALGFLPLPDVLVRYVLDLIFPEALLRVIRELLQHIDQLPSDRYFHPTNPFRND